MAGSHAGDVGKASGGPSNAAVAWACVPFEQPGGGGGGRAAAMVVAWGNELEVLSWSMAPGLAASPAALFATPATRRVLLLGIPGTLRALASGPGGTVVGTWDAGVALTPPTQDQALRQQQQPRQRGGAGSMSGPAGDSGEGDVDVAAAAGGRGDEDEGGNDRGLIDLRGRLCGLGLGEDGPMGQGASSGLGLAGLMDITGSGRSGGSSGLLSGFGSRGFGGGLLGGGGGGGGTAAMPSKLLLADTSSAAVLPARLAVIHPGWISKGPRELMHAAAGGASTSTSTSSAAAEGRHVHAGPTHAPGHSYRGLMDLQLARPDVLTVHGGLVMVGSGSSPAVLQLFSLSAQDGLRGLHALALSGPGLRPADTRLRGVSVMALPHQDPAVQAAPPQQGNDCQQLALLALMGQLERSGAPITALSRSGAAAPLRMAPLLVSVHALPRDACRAAVPPSAPRQAARTQHDAAAGSALTAPLATPPGISSGSSSAAAAAPAPPAAAPAGMSAHELMGPLMSQLGGMLTGLQAHIDKRLDGLAADLADQKKRLETLEAKAQTGSGTTGATVVTSTDGPCQ